MASGSVAERESDLIYRLYFLHAKDYLTIKGFG